MSFSLCFAPEFFLAEGEPYDRSDNAVNADGKPTSVWSAIAMMSEDQWAELAREYYSVDPEFLTPETVLDSIRETDTCSDLTSPVEVWIDPEGYFKVEVYE